MVQRGTVLHKLFSAVVKGFHLDETKIDVLNSVTGEEQAFFSGDADVLGTGTVLAQKYLKSGEGKVIFSTENEDAKFSGFGAVVYISIVSY